MIKYLNKLLPRIIWLKENLESAPVDNKSDTPTVPKPIIIVNIPNQWRTDTCRCTNIFENIAVKIMTEPKTNIIEVQVQLYYHDINKYNHIKIN